MQGKKQLNVFMPLDLWKKFSKKCIDMDKAKTRVIIQLIEKFVGEK